MSLGLRHKQRSRSQKEEREIPCPKLNSHDHIGFNDACGHLAFDAAFIDTTPDLEGSVVSLIIPRVRDDPAVLAHLGAPAEDLDGVAAQLRTADLVINTAGAGREVLVHREGTGDGTVLHHILLDSFHGAQAVR